MGYTRFPLPPATQASEPVMRTRGNWAASEAACLDLSWEVLLNHEPVQVLLRSPSFLWVSAEAAANTRQGLGIRKHRCSCIYINRYNLASNCLLTRISVWNQFVLRGNEASYATVIKMNFVISIFFLFL